MAYSMTGFGRGEAEAEIGSLAVEMKAVNHRYLDIAIRISKELMCLEDVLRTLVKERLARGRVDIFVRFVPSQDQLPKVTINGALATAYLAEVHKLKETTGLTGDLTPGQLFGLPQVVSLEEPEWDPEALRTPLLEAAGGALENLVTMRKHEGLRLVEDIGARLELLSEMLETIKERSPLVVDEHQQRLQQRLQDLLPEGLLDEGRLMQEVALLADRSCITEETVRLSSHFAQTKTLLAKDQPIGRQLDFLVQEMNREINTIGSKANDSKIAQTVVEMKSELEKIREQTQNVE